jgi:hypothetical protein
MGGFLDCLVKAGLTSAQQKYIVGRSESYQKNGMSEIESHLKAIDDMKHETVNSLHDVYSQLGVVAKSEQATPTEVPPPQEPTTPPPTEVPQGESVGITHEATGKLADELGLPAYEKHPESLPEWDANAKERLKEPDAVPKLIERMKSGRFDYVDQRMVGMVIGDLKAKYNETRDDATLQKLQNLESLVMLKELALLEY